MKNLTNDAIELLKDLDQAYLDYTQEEYANWEDTFDLIDRARVFLTDYLNNKTTP